MQYRVTTVLPKKAEIIKQKQRKWLSLEKSKIESLLIAKQHRLVTKRNSLVLQKAFLEAQMLRLSKLAQKKKIQRAVEQYFDAAMGEYKRIGLPTQKLENQRKQSDKLALKILNAPKAIESRKNQKYDLAGAIGMGAFTALPASGAIMGVASHDKSQATAVGVAGSGAIAVLTGGMALNSLKEYWEKRGGIKAMSKHYKKQIQQIDGQLKRIKK